MTTFNARYIHKIAPSDKDVGGPFEIPDGAFADTKALGKALRKIGVLTPGARVRNFRVEADRVVIFPTVPGMTTYWHAVVLTEVETTTEGK